jgi:hypothetical protein
MVTALETSPSEQATEALKTAALRISPPVVAFDLWERYLTSVDRKRLGNDIDSAYLNCGGTAGMWARLRGVTLLRAVLDVAKLVGALWCADHAWLLREFGEFADAEEAMQAAIDAEEFVLIEYPRAAYWRGEQIEIDWTKENASWEFLWELGRCGKADQFIDSMSLGENSHPDIIAKRKSRLTKTPTFPCDLADSINRSGRGSQKLTLPPERIRIFEKTIGEKLREWTP